MTGEWSSPPDTPWHRMVALHVIYDNIFTDTYAGDKILMNESANNILERIRPETGNLLSLRNFKEQCEMMNERLDQMGETVKADKTFHQTTISFMYRDVIGAPVIDHIGDYSERAGDDSYTMTDD